MNPLAQAIHPPPDLVRKWESPDVDYDMTVVKSDFKAFAREHYGLSESATVQMKLSFTVQGLPLFMVYDYSAFKRANVFTLARATLSGDIRSDALDHNVDLYTELRDRIAPFAEGLYQRTHLSTKKPTLEQIEQDRTKKEIRSYLLRAAMPNLVVDSFRKRSKSLKKILQNDFLALGEFDSTFEKSNDPDVRAAQTADLQSRFQNRIQRFVTSKTFKEQENLRYLFATNDIREDFGAFDDYFEGTLRKYAWRMTSNPSDFDDNMQLMRLKLYDVLCTASPGGHESKSSIPYHRIVPYLRLSLKNKQIDFYRATQAQKRVVLGHTTNAGDISNPNDTKLGAHIAAIVAREWQTGTASIHNFTIYKNPKLETRDDEFAFHTGKDLPYEADNVMSDFQFPKKGEKFSMEKSYGVKLNGEYPPSEKYKAPTFDDWLDDIDF